jgi:hypothetical protein
MPGVLRHMLITRVVTVNLLAAATVHQLLYRTRATVIKSVCLWTYYSVQAV